ncbi:ABC-type nitrate/sulfonate/bicarbonate transport system, periplasmic component [Frankia casuarinae]|jgi:sulfonate transport system substrate-binding protein|uniref:Sulfonate binding protein n=1 Tax=Frankia casuarinae (strain DSM 45818 / CECT 9043 / HFP020203 / CcI3) TaxID=106370 RepID=Q2JGF3_FRACC|nr:ABC transporter substrate-binding protein [Frankia casuarinae]ABD09639.1 putative sulfonate binding protein precursor [Frankia casuarinae]EYT93673.1 ABC-type nitrate/sulfonate/bicarbonate transport system, periplasmic component [Frankia casuarinae]
MQHRRPRGRRLSLLAAGLAAAVAVTLAACGNDGGSGSAGSAATGGQVTLRIGDQGKYLELPLTLSGEARGTSYGLSWNTFADGPHMNAAFSASKIDVGFMGDTPVLFANGAHAGVTAVAVAENPVNTQTIIVKAGSGIHKPADLKGRRIALTLGTSLHGYLLNQLASAGLKQSDITPVNVPITSLGATLASGRVDAIVYAKQYVAAVGQQAPGSYEIETKPLPVFSVVLASKNTLKDPAKRTAVQDFLIRLSRASAWPKAHEDEWIKKYYVGQLKQNPQTARKYFDSLPRALYKPVSESFIESQRVQARLLIDVDQLPKTLNVNDEIDKGFNAELTAAFTKASLAT